ncbi:MAG: hypothetical protein U0736_29055 [Gemmataceae bacterium]
MPGFSFTNLPNNAVARYGVGANSWTWPVTTTTEEISIEPVLDSAQRTVIYSNISLTLRCVLTGDDIEVATRAVAQILTKPAMPFVYVGKGYAFQVNVGATRDVLWGPIPRNVKLTELTANRSAVLTWSVRCAIPDGPGARFKFAPMAMNFTVDYDIDESGLTTRVVNGHLRIPMTRNSPTDRRLPDNVDSYREDICPPFVEGFRRVVPGSFHLNEGKDRIDFRFVDQQFESPNLPPVGCIKANATHQFNCPPGKLTQWNHTISGSYEIARTGAAGVANARNAFLALVADRVKASLDEIDRAQPTLVNGAQKKASAVPLSFRAQENIYGKPTIDYSMSWRVAGPDLPTMLQACGMGRPVPGGRNWKAWSDSVASVLGPRGQIGLTFGIGDDKIVDLFQPAPVEIELRQRQPNRGGGLNQIPQGVFPEPHPDSSWLDWRMQVYQETAGGVVEVRTLPTEPRTAAGDVYGGSVAGGAINSAVGAVLGSVAGAFPALSANPEFFFPPPRTAEQRQKGGEKKPSAAQRRAAPITAIYLIGSALRVKWPIPAPSLSKWGDATLTPANRQDRGEGFWTEVVGNAIWPVYGAAWCLRFSASYTVSDAPPVPPNPLLGGGGQAPLPPWVGDLLHGIGNAAAGAFGGEKR